jgi:hypothetical protein
MKSRAKYLFMNTLRKKHGEYPLLLDSSSERCSPIASAHVPRSRGVGRQIFFINADVKASLLKLLFNVDLALLHKWHQIAAQPRNLRKRKPMLGEVDRLPRKVRRGGISLGRRCITVSKQQTLLELHGPNSRVHLQRSVEPSIVRAGQRCKEFPSPWTAVSPVARKPLVDKQRPASRNRNQQVLPSQIQNVLIVGDAIEPLAIGHHVLVDKDLVRTFERRRNDQTPAAVVKRWLDVRDGRCNLDGLDLHRPVHRSSNRSGVVLVTMPSSRCGVKHRREEGQECKRQSGCSGGVYAHSHLEGAKTPEHFLQ